MLVMLKHKMMRTKNNYQQGLYIYLKGREEYKKRGKNVAALRSKINQYRIQIRRIEHKEAQMKRLAQQIKDFTE